MTAADLLATVEHRIRLLTEQERRARFERQTLTREASRLRTAEDPELVLARLAAQGVTLT